MIPRSQQLFQINDFVRDINDADVNSAYTMEQEEIVDPVR